MKPISVNDEGFYMLDGYAFEQGDPFSEDSAKRLADKINLLQETCFPGNAVYVSIIPEKEYYAGCRAPEGLDYDALADCVEENLVNANYIRIADALKLESFYKTDPHWKQEELFPVLERLGSVMGFSVSGQAFTAESMDGFQGTCASYIDLNGLNEPITWLTDRAIQNAVVTYFDHPETQAVYNTAHLADNGYDLYLEGATPLLTIDNPLVMNGKTLILFRDSFASSIAPLMISEYSQIIMVDLRYMISDLLPQMIDFSNADILFLYSASVANESRVLR